MPPRMKVETESSGSNVTRVDASSKPVAPKAPEPSMVPSQSLTTSPKPSVDVPKPSIAVSRPSVSASQSQVVASDSVQTPTAPSTAPAAKVIKATIEVSQPHSDQPTSASSAKSATAVPKTTASKVGYSAQAARPKIGVQSRAPEYTDESAWDSQDEYAPSTIVPEQEPQAAPKKTGFKLSIRAFSNWVHTTFPGHEYAFMGGVVALLVAILILIAGPLNVILLSLAVLVGVAIGQYFDGDPKIIRMITGLFNNDREQ